MTCRHPPAELLPGMARILAASTIVVAMLKAKLAPFSNARRTGRLSGLDVGLASDTVRKLGP